MQRLEKLSCIIVSLLAVACLMTASESAIPTHHVSVPFNRTSFPAGFTFGAGMAAYQSEGAANIDGRGPSIWDVYTKQQPERIFDRSNGKVADDFYHRYKEDIQIMKHLGLDSFRFSISWTRIFPKGKGEVNPLGVKFYNKLINELLHNGLTPFVTIYHWDLPQTLWEEYGGFLSSKLVNDYVNYADFCFKTFGDRVKYWVTFNEPYSISVSGYNTGNHAPGRCSNYVGNCTAGNSATEPYIVNHNLLLSHAAAVKLYRQKYQKHQKGQIGITLVTNWFEPKDDTTSSKQASLRTLDFFFGWCASPITYGYYPKTMVEFVGDRLPKFTQSESMDLKGSIDFLGVNYYTTNYAEKTPLSNSNNVNKSFLSDIHATLTTSKNGVLVGAPTALDWLFIHPKGMQQLAVYIKDYYMNPPVYITENGVAETRNDSIPIKEALKDAIRIRYYDGHLRSLLAAIKEGANVKGFYAWSFFDDFEWDAGYTVRFGIIYVDFKHQLRRYLKYSAYWLKTFLLK